MPLFVELRPMQKNNNKTFCRSGGGEHHKRCADYTRVVSTAMELIVDLQGFKNSNNEFIVKELSIVSTDERVKELRLFSPPYGFSEIPGNVQKQVMWLEKRFHGLRWVSGTTPYCELKALIQGTLRGTVYVKGSEKEQYMSSLLTEFDVAVIDLDDLDCPNLTILKRQFWNDSQTPCIFEHGSKNCAYVNTNVLLRWWKLQGKKGEGGGERVPN